MTENGLLLDIYTISGARSLHIAMSPRRAILSFESAGLTQNLVLDGPQSFEALVAPLGDLYGIRVIDLNIRDGRQLEFGRYQIEFWDEDNCLSETIADGFRVTPSE